MVSKTFYAQHSVTKNILYSSIIEMQIQSSYCVCVVFSSHSFWTASSLDVPAGVTQEEGHTGFLIHLLSGVLVECVVGVWLIVLASSSAPYGKVPCLILKKTSRRTQAVVVSEGIFCAARCCVIFYLQSMKVYLHMSNGNGQQNL